MGRDTWDGILVLGATGQVGRALACALPPLGPATMLGRASVDLSDHVAIRRAVREHHPRVIVNAAAYTAVDRAESEPALAQAINAEAPGILAEEASAIDAGILHYSTDYVFDGTNPIPYTEDDATAPLSVYGRTKLDGERAVAAACDRHVILRTSWVFGTHGANFVKTILRLAAERDALRVVGDQRGAPTSAALIAAISADVVRRMLADASTPAPRGVFHLAAAGETTWADYARHVIDRARALGAPLRATSATVEAITTAEFAAPAPRPSNSRLSTAKLRRTLGSELPDWRRDVDHVVAELCAR